MSLTPWKTGSTGFFTRTDFFYFFSSLARKNYSYQCWWQKFGIYITF